MAASSGSPRAPEAPPPRGARGTLGFAIGVIGLTLLLLGWYRISGETLVARQLPYLASASLPGLGLVVAGALLVAVDRIHRSNERASHMVSSLYRLLTEAIDGEPGASAGSGRAGEESPSVSPQGGLAVASSGDLVVVPGGTRYHRPECELVVGKSGLDPLAADTLTERDLLPCPICDPPEPGG